ncbi:ribonuclease P protein component [Tepidicaulis marinus]|uniref:Ribonuclease P protein component n=1 Tax=Tepidicaulis marinus TaxID=1333998 RepID=A0A081BB78_9HYPH|nr:ribonuclease P protein component [Tepidicaulis marinus]GAK45296.1 ribonuclease P protein component [Tepidicaulis marinus]
MDRLRKRRDFLSAAKGHKWAAPGLVLQARARPRQELDGGEKREDMRVGFTVTKKVGNAVIRNRAKRRLRAAARDVLPEAGKKGFDYVLIGRKGTITRPYSALLKDLHLALARVHGAKRGTSPRGGQPAHAHTDQAQAASPSKPQPKE